MTAIRCAYCLTPVTDVPATCARCRAGHHADCWVEGAGCATLGCGTGAATPAEPLAPARFCDRCGRATDPTHRRCGDCGSDLY